MAPLERAQNSVQYRLFFYFYRSIPKDLNLISYRFSTLKKAQVQVFSELICENRKIVYIVQNFVLFLMVPLELYLGTF